MAGVQLNRSGSDGGRYEGRRHSSSVTSPDMQLIKGLNSIKNEDWKNVQSAITKLFQLRRLPELMQELPGLHERLKTSLTRTTAVRFSKSEVACLPKMSSLQKKLLLLIKLLETEVGQFISESYQDHILKKCMIILRRDVRELKGPDLLDALSEVWCQLFQQILPTLELVLAPTPIAVHGVTLVAFRDHVLLKTPLREALEGLQGGRERVDQRIRQMLLVLQGVPEFPAGEGFHQLIKLLPLAVDPYICISSPTPSLLSPPSISPPLSSPSPPHK